MEEFVTKDLSVPDILLVNANVITLDPSCPRAEMVIIRHGRVTHVGNESDLKIPVSDESQVIDCRGKTVVPGFNDSHCHFVAFAESLMSCTFQPKQVRSISDIQERIRYFARSTPSGTWIRARAYDEFYLREKRHPTRWDLDEATSEHPVKLTHRSGNGHVLNSMAMAIVGISNETTEPPGAIIDRELTAGQPNGVLFGMGPRLSRDIPSMNADDQDKGAREAYRKLLSSGITSIQDASSQNDLDRFKLFAGWKERGDLGCRVRMMLGFDAFRKHSQKDFSHFLSKDELGISGVKIILHETTGRLCPSQTELNEMVFQVHRSGFQVAVHAVEETTIEAACHAIEYALRKYPRSDHRHRIEHCSVCPPDLAARLHSLGITVCTQPSFIFFNGDRYLKTVPRSQSAHLYPVGTLMKNRVNVCGGSDFPIVPLNPILGIYAAVSRMSDTNEPVLWEEKITPLEALRMYTEYPARATFEEKIKGTIAPGKLADLAVLSDDPTRVPTNEIRNIQVKMTILNGKVVWEESD
ncbi:MAG: amidohydrolase [Thermodesulfobacteriota bacterium]|nr:amidohydrolase [Thermodesulfobacteriota bacterium]